MIVYYTFKTHRQSLTYCFGATLYRWGGGYANYESIALKPPSIVGGGGYASYERQRNQQFKCAYVLTTFNTWGSPG